MRIKTTYRDDVKTIPVPFGLPNTHTPGIVRISDKHAWNGNAKHYTVVIEAHELLAVAEACLKQVNAIARTSYRVRNIL